MLKHLLESKSSVKLCKAVTLFYAGFWLFVLVANENKRTLTFSSVKMSA